MNFLHKIVAFFTAIILCFLATGCSDKSEKAYIYFELTEKPTTIDAQTASTDSELLIVKNIYEGLLRKNEKGKIDYGVAEKYTKKGLKYTFKLRKDAVWSNGDKVTAYDFEFSFRRAVSSDTNSPFASRLFCIKNAQQIFETGANLSELGVKAKDKHTLIITLCKEDNNFLETLTTSVAMPCNKKFFESTSGKYGLSNDTIISNGSYKFSKWNKETFGIRLYKNKNYKGEFEAKNAAVFISCTKDSTPYERLTNNKADVTFIDCSLTEKIENLGFKTVSYENICWFLTINSNLPQNIRKSLSMLIGSEVFASSLETGYSPAASIFPSSVSKENVAAGIVPYNLESGKELYMSEVQNLENKTFPSSTVLYYYDNGSIKPIVTDIVGHWQKNLGAYVNIKSASSPELLTGELLEQTYDFAVFPVRADKNVTEYIKNFGITYGGEKLSDIQTKILKSDTIIPLVFQNTTIAYSPEITKMPTECGNGYIDFAFIIKHSS